MSRWRKLIKSLRAREDGFTTVQIVAAIVAPAIALTIGMTLVSFMRTGNGLIESVQRDTQMRQMVEQLQASATNMTAIDVVSEREFTVYSQPSKRSAYAVPSGGDAPTECVSTTWSLTEDTWQPATWVPSVTNTKLSYVERVHEGDGCDTPVKSEKSRELGGFEASTVFEYENAYGRDLAFVEGVETGVDESKAPRPEGLFDNEWAFTDPGLVTLAGEINQVIGTTPVQVTATTPLKQMRPGVVQSGLGDLQPPTITRTARGGDLYRATFSARTSITDPRATITWQWREKLNDGEWSAWSEWSSTDFHERNVRQGEKWNIQAHYKVTLDERNAESEAVEHQFIREISNAAAPTVKVVATGPTGTITVEPNPAICAPGTTAKYQIASAVGGASFGAWVAGSTASVAIGEGQRLNGRAQAKCESPFATSPWVDGPVANAVRPITTAPIVATVTSYVPAGESRGYVKATFSGCPTGTSYQAAPRYSLNAAAANDSTTWTALFGTNVYKTAASTVTYNAAAVREGERFRAGINARCATEYTTGPGASKSASNVVNPIRTVPSISRLTSSISSTTATVTGTFAGCPSWLTYEGRIATMKDAVSTWSLGGWTDAVAGVNSRSSSASYGEGSRFKGGLDARCISEYTEGPVASARSTDYVVRSITSKPTVTNLGQAFRNTSYGAVGADIGGCPAGLTYKASYGFMKNLATSWTWSSYAPIDASVRYSPTIPSSKAVFNQGNRFRGAMKAICVSPYDEGPEAAAGYPSWSYRPITTLPTITSPSIIITDAGSVVATASLSGCPTDTRYQARMMRMSNGATSYTYHSWADNASGKVTRSASNMHYEGYRVMGGISAMCVESWSGSRTEAGVLAQGPIREGVDSSWYIRPVEDVPTVTNPNAVITTVNGKYVGRTAADVASCAAPLKYEARIVVARNGSTTYSRGSFVASAAGREQLDSSATWSQGDSISGGISARCVGLYDTGDAVEAVKTSWTILPVANPAAPAITFTSSSPLGTTTAYGITSSAPTCASGTTLQRQTRIQHNDSGVWGSWATYTGTRSGTINQGTKSEAMARARCVGDNDESAWVNGPVKTNVKAIATKPTVASPSVTITSANKARTTAKISGCPSGTTYEARIVLARNAATSFSYGTASYAAPGTVTRDSTSAFYQGDRARGGISANCNSPYASGPFGEAISSGWYTRPVSTKPVIGAVTSSLSGSNLVTKTTITSGCPTGTSLKVRTWSMRNADTGWTKSGTWYAASTNTTISKNSRTDVLEGYRASGAYGAICDGAYANSAETAKSDGKMIIRPITSKPTAANSRSYVEGSNGKWDATLTGRCPSHLTTSVRFSGYHDYASWTQSAWLTQPTSTNRLYWAGYGINQGARWQAGADLRCISTYTQGPFNTYKGAIVNRPITTVPSGSVSARLLSDGTVQGITGSFTACPSGTTVRWRTYSTAGWGSWLTSGQTGWHYITKIGYGGSANVAAQFMCRSDFVNGPGSTKYSANVYRSYPTPSAPGGITAAGGASRACDNRTWTAGVSWSPAAYASYYAVRIEWRLPSGNIGSKYIGTTTATSLRVSGGEHGGSINARVYVRAYGPSGSSSYEAVGSLSQAPGCYTT